MIYFLAGYILASVVTILAVMFFMGANKNKRGGAL